jgi:predicted neutral ceramidase superfamily lipid hydrolase
VGQRRASKTTAVINSSVSGKPFRDRQFKVDKEMNRRIILTQLILALLFTIVIFASFHQRENGDMDVVIFGTLLYLPFVFILCLYNGLTIGLLERINKKIRLINYSLPIGPLLIWFLASGKVITIRYWDIGVREFIIALALILLTNLTGYYFIRVTGEETASH